MRCEGLAIDAAVVLRMRVKEEEAGLAISRIADFGCTRYNRYKIDIEAVVLTGTMDSVQDLVAAEHERARLQ